MIVTNPLKIIIINCILLFFLPIKIIKMITFTNRCALHYLCNIMELLPWKYFSTTPTCFASLV